MPRACVAREHRPRAVRDARYCIAKIVSHPKTLVRGKLDRTLLDVGGPFESKPTERSGENRELCYIDTLKRKCAAGYRRGDKITHRLDQVGAYPRNRSMKFLDAMHNDPVRAGAKYPRPHSVEHRAEILNVRFAGGVVDHGIAVRKGCRHDDVLGRSDARLV